jgi:hypothetical protein
MLVKLMVGKGIHQAPRNDASESLGTSDKVLAMFYWVALPEMFKRVDEPPVALVIS